MNLHRLLTCGLVAALLCGPVVSQPASATPVGAGCPDSQGRTAILSTAQLPSLGNLGFSVDFTMGSPGASAYAFWSLGLGQSPIPLGGGCNLYLEFLTMLSVISQGLSPLGPVTLGPMGSASLSIPIPNIGALQGVHLVLQAAVTDAALALGFTTTNALDLLLN